MLARPHALGAEFKLNSEQSVDAALHELGWLQARKAAVTAETQVKLAAINKEQAEKLTIEIDGRKMTLGERVEFLESALKKWIDRSLAKHLLPGAKTYKLAHGRVGTKSLPDQVGFKPNYDAETVVTAIAKETSLFTAIEKLLALVLGGLQLCNVIRLKPELNKAAIKDTWQKSDRGKKALEKLGLVLETDRETYVIEPADPEVASPSA